MQNRYMRLIPIVISVIILFLSVSFFAVKKISFSDLENRYLTKLPTYTFASLKEGTYIKNLEKYTTDHFPFRKNFMNIKAKYDKLIGKTEINDVYLGSNGYLFMKYNNPKNTDRIIKNLNAFYKKLNYTNMTLLLVPTSITINDTELPPFINSKKQLDTINEIYNNITFNYVDVYETLKKHNVDYQMFYKLDHHWTTYGAYYAYQEFMKSNNSNYLDINDFDIKEVSNNFKGTLYSKVMDTDVSDSIYIFDTNNSYKVEYEDKVRDTLYELSYLDKKDKYAMFLDNNHALIKIENETLNNNKSIVVIKDSFANSFIPFLTNHYKYVHVIDPRFYKEPISDYVKDNKIKDVLILYNINTIDQDTNIINIK